MDLLVRRGPPPLDTEDSSGELHGGFTGFFLFHLSPAEVQLLAVDPSGLRKIIAPIWSQVTAEGDGHILVGKYSKFQYLPPEGLGSCGGQSWGATAGGIPFAPQDYEALYAVARMAGPEKGKGIDIAIDYRGTAGPGDPTIRPIYFDTGETIC